MLERWFWRHPNSVGETYLEHEVIALSFSWRLFAAALACFIHALVPGLFQRTASSIVTRLHDEMTTKRVRRVVHSDSMDDSAFAAFDAGV